MIPSTLFLFDGQNTPGGRFCAGYVVVDAESGKEIHWSTICGDESKTQDVADVLEKEWRDWHRKGAVLFTDGRNPWNAQFMEAMWRKPEFHEPHDLEFLNWLAVMPQKGATPRLPNSGEEYPDNPLCNARYWARVLVEAMGRKAK